MAFISNIGIAFQDVADQYEKRIALFYPASGERVTYGELNLLADRIAGILWAKHLRPSQVAAIFHDKSPAAFATMLACLRLGIVYTNLDPQSPWERLRKVLGTCRPSLIINAFPEMPFAIELEAGGFRETLHLREMSELPADEPLPDYRAVSGGAPAYIMFTSGSTGVPKGAVMSHVNLLWFIAWAKERFVITPDDVLTNVNPIFFDNSVFDFYSAIFSGATLVPFSAEQVREPRQLIRYVADAGCTIWFSVPSLLVYLLATRALAAADLSAIRKIVFGGEGFPKPKLRQLYDMFSTGAELENVYGPTECTCICSAHTISAVDFEDMQSLAPLGLLAQNFDFEILPLDDTDPNFGELFLRGPQVGLGYYNDPDRTAKVFVQNPHHTFYADVGYRTGDLVRRDAYGRLHFKGRVDFQIKHMGYRIELEEIEAALNTFPAIKECAVIYQELGAGLGQILAFVAVGSPVTTEALLRQIAAIVPSYMVPRRVIVMDSLPKSANGKTDRSSLQALCLSN
ncbi:MAG: amino acid adenylation domain-containing protein [Sulfuricella sp.]|nr:amino acid adenylation domain-containing protein [Sulfuricella sp.]